MKSKGSQNSAPLLISALILALLFAVYYYLILPKQNEAKALNSSVLTIEQEIKSLQEQITLIKSESNDGTVNEFEIRKKLPDNRQVGQLIRSFEEIEFATRTRITSISFNDYDTLVSTSGLQDPNYVEEEVTSPTDEDSSDVIKAEASVQENSENAEKEDGASTLPVSSISAESLPTNLKLITYSLVVEVPEAETLLKFIKEVEKLERVMHVDLIEYSLFGEEVVFAKEDNEVMSVTLQVTTFYYE